MLIYDANMGKLFTAIVMQILWSCSGLPGQQTSPFQFTQTVYNTTIYENSAAKSYVECPIKMGIYITDPSWDIQYKIESGDGEVLFKAEEYVLGDFSFLRIRTKGGSSAILNREVKELYSLRVKALKWSTNAVAQTRVQVRVLDTNDLRPLFSPTSYTVSVPENAAIRTSIVRVTATDADVGSNAEYYFSLGGEHTDMFAIHPTSGVITLMARLDYAERRLFEMDVLAVDRGMKLYGSSGFSSTAKLTVRVLQANEHAPVLTAVLLAPSAIDTDPTYALVTVEDNDQGPNGEIASLSIVAGDPLQQFRAVKTSPGGKEYRVKAIKDVDWDSCQFGCNLTLQAEDKGSPPQFSSAEVIRVRSPRVDVRAPTFEKNIYRVNLTEFAPPNTSVVMVRAMPNHPMLKYSIKYPKIQQITHPFTINSNTGLITTTAGIQADRASKYDFEVIINNQEQASTRVVINVIDVNNNAPVFQQPSYKGNVNENVPVGTSILTVSASDMDEGENGYVTYTIANVNPPQPFTIDYFTGVISTARELDYEKMPRVYNLRVRASDWGSPFRREVETPVSITLNNLNDNEPLFEKVDCEVSLPRYYRVGEQIVAVSAIDADDMEGVQHVVIDGNSLGLFDLTPDTGLLSLKLPLNDGEAARLSFHSLQISANDGETSSKPMFVNITVLSGSGAIFEKCVDTGVVGRMAEKLLLGTMPHSQREDHFEDIHSINNYSPHFVDSTPKVIEVKEDLQVGMSIAHLSAIDADSGFSGTLMFVISGGDVESRFMIEMDTGWLKIMEPLDREITDQYTLNITVYDLGIPQRSASHVLQINVLDSNDNSPNFLQNSYSVSIREDTDVGTAVIQVDATDKDSGANRIIRYSLMAESDHFVIDDQTGVVKVKSPLDRELHPTIILKVVACDQAVDEPQMISTVSLKIVLEDVNDNPPRFFPLHQRVKVREDLPLAAVVVWLQAHDPDQGQSGQVRFSLLDNGDGDFDVDKTNGAVRILRTLDFERRQVYNLTARAKDKGKPESLSCTCFIEVYVVDVDENLHQPRFASFVDKGSVREDAPIGTNIMTVTAQDNDHGRDGEIRYSIRDGSGLGVFTIDEESGVIQTQELLDHETTNRYWLTIYGTDLAVVPQSSFMEVYIEVEDVNDNAPQTSEPVYYPEVMENSPKDVSVFQVEAVDPDSGNSDQFYYKITSGNPQGFFSIDHQTGLVTTTSRKLDREQQEEHTLEITVTDKGVPARSTAVRVVVRVQDENDNTPQFLEKIYKVQLPERDRDRSERDRDRSDGDRERPTERRGVAKREPIYRVIASDRDRGPNAEVSYSIEGGDEQGRFFIEPQTGHVFSREAVSAGQHAILTIKVVDNGRPQRSSTCRLHIEWIVRPEPSSEPLVFEETSLVFSVMETDPVAHMVGVISTQPIDAPVWFQITGDMHAKEVFHIAQMACDLTCTTEGGNADSRFDVGKGSGTVILAKPLHAEPKSNYSLTVEATDGNRYISTQVFIKVIDTNNHQPQFSQPQYEISIPEDTAPETGILQLSATDRDQRTKLTFTLLSSTDLFSQRRFRLDPGTGQLYTTEPLDHEVMNKHTLTVMVCDDCVPIKRNLVRVIVNVEDTNDNTPWFTSPRYSGQVFESAAVGSAVLQVTAQDRDRGSNAEISYIIESGNEDNSFAIDLVLGTITVAKELDRDDKSQFELAVKASDRGAPPLSAVTTVRIAVTVPDNARPRFPEEEISAVISETAPVGSLVTLVSASSHSSVLYQIREGNVNNAFDINPTSGVVVTQRLLDYESVSSYRLTVQATNMAEMVNYVTVLIHLRDENDNSPVFTQTEFRGVVSESAPVNSVVLTNGKSCLVIQATDADSDLNGRLVYQIVEPYALEYFAIDSSTGAIRTVTGLDYEQRSEFNFTVQVHDSGKPQLFSEIIAYVTIHITDVNDCPPTFSQDVFETSVIVPTYSGVKVISINATDLDSGVGSKLLFSISDGNIGGQFMIDPKSGVISVLNPAQLRNGYELTVRVSDGKFTKTAMVKINIRENQNKDLAFAKDLYTVSLPENSSERKTLAVVTAARKRLNEPLFYTILNPQGRFEIGHTSGVLFTTGVPFDREEQDTFEIVVEVTKEHRSSGVAHALVVVTIEDVNDNEPVFVGLPYSALVQLDSAVGQVVRQITTVDKDIGRNAEIKYQLKEDWGYFQISPTGEISLKRTIHPKDVDTKFAISIIAKDRGDPSHSATVEVAVTVVSKAVPVFEKSSYDIVIPEDVPLDTSIVKIQANASEGPRTVYSISKGDPLGQFSISFITGVLHVVQPLDYETHPAYRLSIRASDSLTGAHSEVFLDIILEDVNDNAPTFKERLYEASVSELADIDSSVLQVSATDSDSGNNKVLFYQLVEEGGGSDYFTIDQDSGVIMTSGLLDFEVGPQHRLVVRAVDGGVPAQSSEVPVIISVTDINDNPPVFTQHLYKAMVSQLAQRGHFVACVRTSDADLSDTDRLEYSLLSGNEDSSFTIDGRSGEIVISKYRKLNRETLYNLSVSVSDGLYSSVCNVQVTVVTSNLHSPSFSHTDSVVELLENSPVGTLVTQVTATDKDLGVYGKVTYYIVNDVAKDKFTINENGEIFTVESLDRENVISNLISISLMAKDGGGKLGFTSVNVILTDVNDNAPQFRAAEYKANIPRDVSEGTVIVRVTAVDADEGSNADITYTVQSEVGGFDIHPLNGDIIAKNNFTAYKNDLFSFYVSAKDAGDPPKKTLVPVYIRLLPKEVTVPKLVELQKRWSVSEGLPIGSEIDVIQESEQLLIYNLVKGSTPESNQDQVFVVNTDTGKLKLAKRLDFETTKWYLLTLQAQGDLEDIDVITTAQLHIQVQDVNDNSPQFESDSYRSFVVENLPKGTSVIQVKATDLDSGVNGQVTYSLDQYQNSVEVLGMFAVDEESGWVTTLKELDREQQDRYSVAVLATDRGHDGRLNTAATVEVTVVDVNDNPMRFMAEVFRASVSEDIPVPSRAIAVLRTTDRDSEDLNKPICCFITGGDPRAQFDLEHSQGEWRVVVRRALDREERDSYLLNVTASDGTSVTTATVEISVLDANDNSPVCERALYAQTVPENTPEGRLVLRVSAIDADIQSNAQISYTLSGDGADYFSIESDTGRLRTLLPLDREERDVYSLLVQAEDGGQRYCQANVVITVGDVNDNAPEFTADPYPVTVFENTEINAYVARLQATDLDAGNNSRILYSFEDSADGRFSIQQHSGLVRVERPLVRTQAGYTLRVRATDQGSPRRLSSVCSVLVSVLSVNDRPPAFQNRDYGVTVSEDVTLGTQVVRVFAASGDPKATADITYSIVNGNEHGMFSMDSHTGDIFVTKALDYEASHEHYLTVQASDKGRTSQGDIATVTIYLTDVNDNSPVFSQEVYSAVISEDTDMGLTMLTVMADDIDGPSNNHIHFSIVKGNQAGPFTIDTVSGEVKVVCPLDREKVPAYTLTVLASDSGSPSRSSSALVNIDVSDVNDNAPVFSEADYSLVIQESVPVGNSVLKLTVTDRDASHNGPPFSFIILGGDEGGSFLIDPQGTLRTTTLLDRTVKDHYILHAQVLDSGRPPILASTVINIRVIQESLHPPAILPLEVLISTPGEAYPGGVLGQIRATDQDLYDSLTYNLQPNLANTLLFSLSPSDGRLVTRPGHVLKLGHYLLNVTVTDGRFTTATGVSVHVHQVTKRMLESSVAVRLAGVGPEEFVGEHWRGFLRVLRMVAGIKRSDVQLVSLQPCEPPGSLDVLLALERSPPGSPLTTTKDGILLRKLNASVGAIQEVTGLRVVRVFRKLCAGLDCPAMLCSEVVTLDQNFLTTYSTARLSLITPPHHRSAVCLCKGGECPVLKLCEEKPCPEGCVSNQREGPYSCVCPPDQQGGCSGGQSLWFSGKGYIRYRLMENRYREEMKLSLRLRTLSHHATLLFARGTDYCILEIVDGRLQYQFDYGSGPGIVSIHSAQVSDGQWHTVSLEVNGNHAMLVLDQLYTASGTAPGTLRSLNLDGSLFLGGVSESDQQRGAKTASQRLPVSHSRDLQGCMEAVRFNGYDLNLDTEAQAHVLVEEVVGVAPGCGALPVPDCSSQPCVNGGTCSTLPHGGYFCKCSDLFMGSHCEVTASPCSSNPCLYGGTCVLDNQDFYCQCRGQYSGPRCAVGPYCKDDPCRNSGHCIDSLDGAVCECEPGFQGERCLGDVNECMQTESLCSNGGVCVNTYGSFNCSCVVGFAGRQCELEVLVRNELLFTSWSIGLEELLGLALFLVTIFGLSLLFVAVRKRAKQDGSKEYEDEDGKEFFGRAYLEVKSSRGVPVYLDVPPQIPVRPISYTPSYPSNSRHNLNKGSCEGLGLVEPTEHRTPDPDPVHMLRRGVAVCSVAPTLPRRLHSNTPSETESIQKPCWDYHYDEEVVELDPVSTQRSRKDLENRGSASESLCSYQSGSGDENVSTPVWIKSMHSPRSGFNRGHSPS